MILNEANRGASQDNFMNKLLENACDYGERLEWARGDFRWGYPTRSDRGPSPEHRAVESLSIRAGAEARKEHFEA